MSVHEYVLVMVQMAVRDWWNETWQHMRRTEISGALVSWLFDFVEIIQIICQQAVLLFKGW